MRKICILLTLILLTACSKSNEEEVKTSQEQSTNLQSIKKEPEKSNDINTVEDNDKKDDQDPENVINGSLRGTGYLIQYIENEGTYILVDLSENIITEIPDELSTLLYDEDENPGNLNVHEQYDTILFNMSGEVFIYQIASEKWNQVVMSSYIYRADFIDDNLVELHSDNQDKTYHYNLTEEKLEEVVNIGQSRMSKGINWEDKVYYNYTYQIGENIDPIVFFDSPVLLITYNGSEYVIMDSFTYQGKIYILDQMKEKLIDLETGETLIETSIGNYSFSDGILAYEDVENDVWYYYDFNNQEKQLISNEILPIVMVHHNEICYVNQYGVISILSIDKKSIVDEMVVTDVITGDYEDELLVDFDKNNIYANLGTTYVVQRNSHEIIDSFSTREIHVAENGSFFIQSSEICLNMI